MCSFVEISIKPNCSQTIFVKDVKMGSLILENNVMIGTMQLGTGVMINVSQKQGTIPI